MSFRLAFRRILSVTFEQRRAALAVEHLRPLTVLVASAEPSSRSQLSAAIKRLGHRATVVGDGARAVSLCRAQRFDLVLMDTLLPELDGLPATRAIRAAGGPNAAIPIVALTVDASQERRRFYDRAGLSQFMDRPIDQAQLADLLARIAEQSVVVSQYPGDRTQRAN